MEASQKKITNKRKILVARIRACSIPKIKELAGDVLPRDKFDKILKQFSVQDNVLDLHDIPREGLVFEEAINPGDVGLELKENRNMEMEPYQRDGKILAQWARMNGECKINLPLLLHMMEHTYKISEQRPSTTSFGMNIYRGINKASYVRPTPRKSKEAILLSEKYREEQEELYLPLLHYLTDKLAQHAMQFAKITDPSYDDFQRIVLSQSEGGQQVECNNTLGGQYNDLQNLLLIF